MANDIAEVKCVIQAQTPTTPIIFKLWFMDESRFGLKTIRRRRITKRGIKPIMRIQDEYENTYVFGAVAPADGSSIIWEMPWLNGATFQEFLNAMSIDEQAKDVHNIMITDNAGAHHAKSLKIPGNLSILFLPGYSPELNPAERVWEYMKERFAGKIFSDLAALSDHIKQVVESLSADIISSLTSPDWVMEVIHAQLLT